MNINRLLRIYGSAEAIKQIVRCDGQRQFSLGFLRNIVQEHFSSDVIESSDIVEALKYLWRTGKLRLTKPDSYRVHALNYTGVEPDSWFFYRWNFNVVIE
jgi:hypothetical protein